MILLRDAVGSETKAPSCPLSNNNWTRNNPSSDKKQQIFILSSKLPGHITQMYKRNYQAPPVLDRYQIKIDICCQQPTDINLHIFVIDICRFCTWLL